MSLILIRQSIAKPEKKTSSQRYAFIGNNGLIRCGRCSVRHVAEDQPPRFRKRSSPGAHQNKRRPCKGYSGARPRAPWGPPTITRQKDGHFFIAPLQGKNTKKRGKAEALPL
jgi:hypothetical protein